MLEQEKDDKNPEGFVEVGPFKVKPPKNIANKKQSFEAYKEELNDDYITISDCRMTRTTSESTVHGVRIKEQYGQDTDDPVDPQDLVIMLYINGTEWKNPNNDAIHTAKGNCIFFVLRDGEDGDHKPITSQTVLEIKKSAHFYCLNQKKNKYERFPFSEITRVLVEPDKVYSSSSPSSSHRQRGLPLNLYPDGL